MQDNFKTNLTNQEITPIIKDKQFGSNWGKEVIFLPLNLMRGVFPRVSGNPLFVNKFWLMTKQKTRYSNITVTYSNRTVTVISF